MFSFRKLVLTFFLLITCPVNSYKMIVLTGGPCAGKTSSLPVLKRAFELSNKKVFILDEVANSLIKADMINLIKNSKVNHDAIVEKVMKITFGTSDNMGKLKKTQTFNNFRNIRTTKASDGESSRKKIFKEKIDHIILSDGIANKFQWLIFAIQLEKENNLIERAKKFEDKCNVECIILCDRGLLDGFAYVSDGEPEKILESFYLNFKQILDRYYSIIHLHNFANDKTLYNKRKESRTEDAQKAKELDDKLCSLWKDHTNRVEIGNINADLTKRTAIILRNIKFFTNNTSDITRNVWSTI